MANYYQTEDGLITLGPELIEIVQLLEARFLTWAGEVGATDMHFPPLLRTEVLNRLDYFQNFPHLGTIASRIAPEKLDDYAQGEQSGISIPATDLADGHYVLQPASCYNVYLHFQEQALTQPVYITTNGHCFRNEKEYTGLTRLWGFHLREIVCIGPADVVKEHLLESKRRLIEVAKDLDLHLEIETATDPFFDEQSKRKLMQQLFPTKEEFLTHDGVAIASCNYHRNFFAERCDIRLEDGSYAFTSCVGFGLERWLHALLDRYDNDVARIKTVCAIGA